MGNNSLSNQNQESSKPGELAALPGRPIKSFQKSPIGACKNIKNMKIARNANSAAKCEKRRPTVEAEKSASIFIMTRRGSSGRWEGGRSQNASA